jgi:hypothetical protein
MNDDFISSSMDTGILVPIGDEGGGGGEGGVGGGGGLGGLPSTVSMVGGDPINSPTPSHGGGPGARARSSVIATFAFEIEIPVVDITVTISPSRGHSSGRVSGGPTLPSKSDDHLQPQAPFPLFFLRLSAETRQWSRCCNAHAAGNALSG